MAEAAQIAQSKPEQSGEDEQDNPMSKSKPLIAVKTERDKGSKRTRSRIEPIYDIAGGFRL